MYTDKNVRSKYILVNLVTIILFNRTVLTVPTKNIYIYSHIQSSTPLFILTITS